MHLSECLHVCYQQALQRNRSSAAASAAQRLGSKLTMPPPCRRPIPTPKPVPPKNQRSNLTSPSVQLLPRSHHTAGAAPACGAPGALCGASLPKGSTCTSKAGYCQAGFFCARCEGCKGKDATTSTCKPVPKGCGAKESEACCPPNAVSCRLS